LSVAAILAPHKKRLKHEEHEDALANRRLARALQLKKERSHAKPPSR
jgi:hypothetical protein